MINNERAASTGTPGGRHRRKLVFSERLLRRAKSRAVVITVAAVLVAGVALPVFPALAEEPTASSGETAMPPPSPELFVVAPLSKPPPPFATPVSSGNVLPRLHAATLNAATAVSKINRELLMG